MPHIQMETVLFVFFAVALIFLIARLATAPVQMMLKLLMNSDFVFNQYHRRILGRPFAH